MDIFNQFTGILFDIVFSPFASLHPLWGLSVISVLTGIMMLFIFRFTSDQKRIREIKNRIRAHIFEFRLFKDDLGLMLEAQKDILKDNLIYMKYSLKPMVFLVIPVAVIMIQLSLRFDRHPLHIGESAIVKVKFRDQASFNKINLSLSGTNDKINVIAREQVPKQSHLYGSHPGISKTEIPRSARNDRFKTFFDENVTLKVPEGIIIETPPLRIPEEREIDWRIKALRKGTYNLEFQMNSGTLTKSLVVDDRLAKVSIIRVSSNFFQQLLYPAEKSLSSDTGAESIEITYPSITYHIFGRQVHWLVIFFVVSIVTGFMLKGFFRVEI